MLSASADLIELLDSGRPFMMADCYTFALASGAIYRYTTFDVDLTYAGTTWLAGGPVLQRGPLRTFIGLEVDTLNLKISPKDSDTLGELSWFAAACSGELDGCEVQMHRAFIEVVPVVKGVLKRFVGRMAPLTIDRSVIEATVNSPLELLNIKMPRNVYQAGCQYLVFDSGCGLNRATYFASGSVSSAPSRTSFVTSLPQGASYYDCGALQFTSGALSGIQRSIKRWDGVTLTLLNPLPLAPAIHDMFTVVPGCDRRQATCQSKFNNLLRFKGTPYVPVPEAAL